MERFWHLRSSRGGDKPCHGCGKAGRSSSALMDRVHAEGNIYAGKRVDRTNVAVGSKLTKSNLSQENSFAIELMQKSSKQASTTPIKKLIAAEMSKEAESRKRSPSVIARLMGLDPLPSHHPAHLQRNPSEIHSQTSPAMFQENQVFTESRSLRKNCNTNDFQEFKDVYEVHECSRAEVHNNRTAKKATVKSRVKEEKIAFIRQKFIDAKRLSTDENLRHSKEFHDALEVLDSNKDLFLKILQEPDPLFAEHLQNLQSSAHSSHITVLKSSKATKDENSESYELKRKIEGNIQQGRHAVCPSHRLPKSQYDEKVEPSHLPTRIVVLKPSMGKTQNSARDTSLTNHTTSPHASRRKHRESRRIANRDLFPELRSRSKLSHTVELEGQRPKGSREIAREITKQMWQNENGGLLSKESSPGMDDFAAYESLCKLPMKDIFNDFEELIPNSRHDWDSRYSPSYSSESYVSREARKRLSHQWKMTRTFQEGRSVSRGANTLGEMLALHDREPANASDGDPSSDRFEKWPCPLGISSRDGWKDGYPRTLSKSRSVPASSTMYECTKTRIRPGSFDSDSHLCLKDITIVNPEKDLNRNVFNSESSFSKSARFSSRTSKSVHSTGMDYDQLVKEIHVMPDVLVKGPEETFQAEEITQDHKMCVGSDCIASDLSDKVQASECEDLNTPSKSEETKMAEPSCIIMEVTERDSMIYEQNDLILQDSSAEHSPFISCSNVKESESPRSSKGAEQPSPVSVLEPPFEEETSCSSECFERVSADLHGLRMQLQLLKLESAGACSEFSVSSIEDCGDGFESSFEERRELSGVVWPKENQDFSFIFDVLVTSGLLATDQEMLFATCYSSENPVALGVLEKLEKKYGEKSEWSPPATRRRKLLFDRINCGLAEILSPCMDQRPWVRTKGRRVQVGWSSEGLAEEVRQLLSRQVKEGSLGLMESALGRDMRWMELDEEIDTIGRELERFLVDELMEEVVAGF
ncbi:hypothetical protein H6P81_006754 [Aristolochia fimbriata]|uniref:DUF4378 domain-containing protein n=1 Tax=Aristolochia fimbriata TaxID=158543 RepID=A0AAV7F0D5_ARIFI|nr:hypothetical protein H6P81_006754 [Aristolochia fimbriata]